MFRHLSFRMFQIILLEIEKIILKHLTSFCDLEKCWTSSISIWHVIIAKSLTGSCFKNIGSRTSSYLLLDNVTNLLKIIFSEPSSDLWYTDEKQVFHIIISGTLNYVSISPKKINTVIIYHIDGWKAPRKIHYSIQYF